MILRKGNVVSKGDYKTIKDKLTLQDQKIFEKLERERKEQLQALEAQQN